MAFRPEHELHKRRISRNLGVGVALLIFVALVYGLTIAKMDNQRNPAPAVAGASQ